MPPTPMRLLAISLALLSPLLLTAAGRSDGENIIRTWTIDDGLPQDSVTSFCQTRDGAVWLGTGMGVARFNGSDFRVFNSWNTPQIKSNSITALAEDGSGALWIGTDGGGLARLLEGEWRTFGRAEGMPGLAVRSIALGKNGDLWAATDAGLALFRNGRWKGHGTMPGLPAGDVAACILDLQGMLWAAGPGGLWRQTASGPGAGGGNFVVVAGDAVSALARDPKGIILLATVGGLKRVDPAAGKFAPESVGLPAEAVVALWADADGTLWAGTPGLGLVCWRQGASFRLQREDGLGDDFIQAICRDLQGNLWVGTKYGGMSRLKPRLASIIDTRDGLPGNQVQAVLADAQGGLWVGLQRRGLFYRQPGGEWQRFGPEKGLPDGDILALCPTRAGGLLVGTTNGLARRLGAGFERLGQASDIGSGAVAAILEGRDGAIWIGGAGGLFRMPPGQNLIAEVEQVPNIPVRSLVEDSGGRIWIGTRQGLYVRDAGGVQKLMAGDDVAALAVSRMEPDVTWVGTSAGLAAVAGGRIVRFMDADGLLANRISAILEVPEKKEIWLGSSQGIGHLAVADLAMKIQGRQVSLAPVFLSEDDGIVRGECASGSQSTACRGADGVLYFATYQGVVAAEPLATRAESEVRPPVFEDIRLDNRSLVPGKQQTLPPGQHLLEFYFFVPDYAAPSKTRFKYKLEGFDAEWKLGGIGKKGAALYYNLRPGRYSFQAAGCGGNGRWSSAAVFSFRIPTSFPLLLVLVPLLIVATAGVSLYYQRRGKRREEPFEPRKKYQTSALTMDRAEEIMKKLKTAVETERVYLNPSLTLKKLSEKLLTHPNHLSQIINENYGQNFNDFINRFRIEEAKSRLLDPAKEKQSILDIAYEVGFFSKSVFNTAFKKFTGRTPSEFRGEKEG